MANRLEKSLLDGFVAENLRTAWNQKEKPRYLGGVELIDVIATGFLPIRRCRGTETGRAQLVDDLMAPHPWTGTLSGVLAPGGWDARHLAWGPITSNLAAINSSGSGSFSLQLNDWPLTAASGVPLDGGLAHHDSYRGHLLC